MKGFFIIIVIFPATISTPVPIQVVGVSKEV